MGSSASAQTVWTDHKSAVDCTSQAIRLCLHLQDTGPALPTIIRTYTGNTRIINHSHEHVAGAGAGCYSLPLCLCPSHTSSTSPLFSCYAVCSKRERFADIELQKSAQHHTPILTQGDCLNILSVILYSLQWCPPFILALRVFFFSFLF